MNFIDYISYCFFELSTFFSEKTNSKVSNSMWWDYLLSVIRSSQHFIL